MCAKVSVKKYVPTGAKSLWVQCLLSGLADVLTHGDLRAWTDLMALPKLTLCTQMRGGRSHRRRQDQETKQRCQKWLEGQRAELWQDRHSHKHKQESKRSPSPETSNFCPRAVEFVREGLLQQACNALLQPAPADISDAVEAEIKGKHPAACTSEATKLAELRPVAAAAALHIEEEMIDKAIRSFHRSSANGPSGLRPQHLKDALVPGFRDEIIRHIAGVVNLLAKGQAPPELQEWLCGASLVAIPKPTGGHRPVAVGETWRRLTGKSLAAMTGPMLRDHFEPVQIGVGSKSGAEALVHSVRQWLGRNHAEPGKVLVTVDIENAFNTVSRSAFLQEIRRVLPGLVPWSDFCYLRDARLLLGDRMLMSMRGVQQGDPLGPALFALAIHGAILETRAEVERLFPGELEICAFFLDDGTLAGSAEAVSHFVGLFRDASQARGLTLAVPKCEVIPAAGTSHSVRQDLFPGWKWQTDRHFQLLGAAFGDTGFCSSHAVKRADKAKALLQECVKLSHTQAALQIVRHCGSWCKLMYTARTVPPSLDGDVLVDFAGSLRKTLECLLDDSLPDVSWGLAQLGMSHGGLGIRDPVRHAGAAYLASLSQTSALCRRIDPKFDVHDACGALHLRETQSAVQANVLEAACIDATSTIPLRQKDLSSKLDMAAHQRILASADTSTKAHCALTCIPTAGAWLTAPPTPDGREIDTPLFKIAVKRRIRCPILVSEAPCPKCGQIMDRWGDHALVCPCQGDRTVRHNAVRNVCFEEALAAGARPHREKAGLLPGRPTSDGVPAAQSARRPADVWLPRGLQGDNEALDFAITSGMQSDRIRQSAATPTAIFEDYESFKCNHLNTHAVCAGVGLRFTPLVAEAHGGALSGVFRGFVEWLGRNVSAARGSDAATESLRIAQRISATLQRENARAVLSRLVGWDEDETSGSAWGMWHQEGDIWQ